MTRSAGQKAQDDVTALLRARNPLLWIVTREEARVETAIIEAAGAAGYSTRLWDCATGVSDASGAAVDVGQTDPAEVVRTIRDAKARQVWILRDLPPWLRDAGVTRAVRSLVKALPSAPKPEARTVVILTPSAEVPPELAGHAIVIDWPMPDRAEVAEILDGMVESLPPEIERPTNGVRDAAIDAAVGLTAEEVQSCISKALVTSRRVDPAAIGREKRRVVNASKVLEWYEPDPRGLDAVGGGWTSSRRG